jgi:hypothetical protein
VYSIGTLRPQWLVDAVYSNAYSTVEAVPPCRQITLT